MDPTSPSRHQQQQHQPPHPLTYSHQPMNISTGVSSASVGGSLQYDQTAALTFHHVDYLLHAYVRYATPAAPSSNDTTLNQSTSSIAPPSPSSGTHGPPMPILVVEAEQRSNGARWYGEFSSRYIEEMSLKTGNFKKFNLFVKMLSSALSKSSEAVFIDLLTFQDLEALKQQKQATSGNTQQPSTSKTAMAAAQNKRYIILTYIVEFDKVHYPLPLKFESDPTPEQLKGTIARLRAELESLRNIGAGGGNSASQQNTIEKYKQELYRLAEENHRLQARLAAGSSGSGTTEEKTDSSKPSDQRPTSTSSSNLSISPHELEQLHIELRSLRQQLDSKQAENQDLHRQMQGLVQGMPIESLGLQTSLDNMSKQIWNLQSELRLEQGLHSKLKQKNAHEQELMLEELQKRLDAERALRKKCQTLQQELDDLYSAIESNNTKGGRGGVLRTNDRVAVARRRPFSATTGSGPSSPALRSPAQRVQQRAGSRSNSRPTSATSSRSSSPAPIGSGPSVGVRGRPRSQSPNIGSGSGRSVSPALRSRSPSPSLSNGGRFDPSAYVKHKANQLAEQQRRQQRQQSAQRSLGGRVSSATQSSPIRSSNSNKSLSASSPSNSTKMPPRVPKSSSTATISTANIGSNSRPSSASQHQSSTRSPRPSSASTTSTTIHGSSSSTKRRPHTHGHDESGDETPIEEETRPIRRRKEERVSESSDDDGDRDHRRPNRRPIDDDDEVRQKYDSIQSFLKQQKLDV